MRKKNLWAGTFAVLSVLLTAAALYPMLQKTGHSPIPAKLLTRSLAAGANQDIKLDTNYVYYEGSRYVYNYNLYNILFLGIDKTDVGSAHEIIGTAGQADSIILLSFDKAKKTIRLLQISRDTMTDIELYNTAGKRFAVFPGQLALQHAYAPGGESSSWAMKQTVSKLLFALQVDAYVTLDIEGVPMINDEIGGVELTFTDDYTEIDKAFEKGQTMVLDGRMAKRFVQERDIYKSGSNQDRMERQTEYILGFFKTLNKRKQEGQLDLERIQKKAEHLLTTDMRLEEIEEMLNYDYAIESSCSIPGEIVQGQIYEEFHVDDDALKRLLIELFYEPVS